ncbi:unnamed protein product [Parascedosporium putredinis]|uniref:DUF221-domain-containing protein n=1 Tax=Parascedosporium putredinis TaxID=1442378 RepID=A0A9P1GXU2_9PEZI|nr:unnamed protein product [Parascedosporium putredinis]CAI7989345.1 unnamed protein product [Parascedosporium putredinis]
MEAIVEILLKRADDPGQELLKLLQDPFANQLQTTSIWTALGTSLGFTAGIAILFSLLRPYNQAVYAPRLKHADEKHAPPPIGKKIWSWVKPLWNSSEAEMVGYVGMDATIFLRFTRMCRNIFVILTVLGCGILIPINVKYVDQATKPESWLAVITPSNVWGAPSGPKKVLALRRKYFESEEYQNSLHARTLMLTDVPKARCSDEGIARIIDEVVPNSSFARTAVSRNVKDLPELINEHDRAVRKLEKVLAIYMKNPQQLPPARPLCYPSKKDPSYGSYPKGQRASVDKRSTMSFGFASYSDIAEAHNIAYAFRKKKVHGATVRLAPRPNDIIWDNMSLTPQARSWKRTMNNLWVFLLTLLWIAPNAMIAIFLVNLGNLGLVWPAFQRDLIRNATVWGIVQGIGPQPSCPWSTWFSPSSSAAWLLLALYFFFVFNNLVVFSLFSAIWSTVAGVINQTQHGVDAWQAIIKSQPEVALFLALCGVSPYWVTWLLQRHLGVALDLSQLWPLVYGFFMRHLSSPTPRELIELTAPPAFDYASYYNYFLFYATVALCFSGIQPLVLPAAALYFTIDTVLRKYLLLYVFVTKTESGGQFWRVLFNRFIFSTVLADLVFFLTTWVRGDGTHIQAFAVIPLPFLVIAFKFVCSSIFDKKLHYYSTHNVRKHPEAGKESRLRSERLASRFGHPALYKPLITPMVHQKAQNMLHVVYKGRLTDGREAGSSDLMSVSGYSDTYALDPMRAGKPGKSAAVPGFEFVSEAHLDFEYYKDRPEFANEHGAGEIFGTPSDIIRPGTPGSMFGGSEGSRPGTPEPLPLEAWEPPIICTAALTAGFLQQPMSAADGPSRTRSPLYSQANNSATGLVMSAAGIPMSRPDSPASMRHDSMDTTSRVTSPYTPGPTVGALGGGPQGYSGLAQSEEPLTTVERKDK